jgi:hypothetical protein
MILQIVELVIIWQIWFLYDSNRAKRVCRSSPEYPSTSLIKEICYPDSKTFFAKQIKWGCDHDKNAKMQYVKKMFYHIIAEDFIKHHSLN